jgi:hypothetical protein
MQDDRDTDAMKRALGGIALVMEQVVRHNNPKLASVVPGSVDAYYMLATFCFDLSRKVNYAFKATRAFASHADPALAREVLADYERLNADDLTWKERAERAEEIIVRQWTEIGAEHERLLKKSVAGR